MCVHNSLTCNALSHPALQLSPGSSRKSALMERLDVLQLWGTRLIQINSDQQLARIQLVPFILPSLHFFPCLFLFRLPWPLPFSVLHIPKKQLVPSCLFPVSPRFCTSVPTYLFLLPFLKSPWLCVLLLIQLLRCCWPCKFPLPKESQLFPSNICEVTV